jgi:hypothetical protein
VLEQQAVSEASSEAATTSMVGTLWNSREEAKQKSNGSVRLAKEQGFSGPDILQVTQQLEAVAGQ